MLEAEQRLCRVIRRAEIAKLEFAVERAVSEP
jgi:hypothetical protein